MSTPPCRVCGSGTRVTHEGLVLGRHHVRYHLCDSCDHWFTDEPWWLAEAYSAAISAADTGLVLRNTMVARDLTAVLGGLFDDGPFVDWAGGYGMLVRLMRDAGFDFRWADAYAENLLARGFDWTPGGRSEAVTAIEVLEHVPDPVGFVQECLDGAGTDTIIFSQELHHGPDQDWWYLTPATGQHISFYTSRTLSVMGERLGLHLHSSPRLHMLTRRDLPAGRFSRLVRRSRLLAPWYARRRESLMHPDHRAMLRRLAEAGGGSAADGADASGGADGPDGADAGAAGPQDRPR